MINPFNGSNCVVIGSNQPCKTNNQRTGHRQKVKRQIVLLTVSWGEAVYMRMRRISERLSRPKPQGNQINMGMFQSQWLYLCIITCSSRSWKKTCFKPMQIATTISAAIILATATNTDIKHDHKRFTMYVFRKKKNDKPEVIEDAHCEPYAGSLCKHWIIMFPIPPFYEAPSSGSSLHICFIR